MTGHGILKQTGRILAAASLVCALPLRADFGAGLRAYERGDYTAAVKEFASEAERGHAGAQNLLGLAYATGHGVPQNNDEAIKWFRRSAAQGDDGAQFNLGTMYSKGQGVPQDYAEAAKWYTQAAARGNARAQLNMGILHYNGQGVARDNSQALMWFQLAAARGNQQASALRDGILKSLAPAQIADVDRLAAQWEKAHRPGAPAEAPRQEPANPVRQERPQPRAAAVGKPAPAPAPQTAAEHHRRGRQLSTAGRYREAVQELSEALRLDPSLALAYNARGFAYFKLRDFNRAAADFTQAIALRPDYGNAYRNRANARKLAGDPKWAEDLAKAQ